MKSISALLLFFICAQAQAQSDGLLWRVSGNGLKHASYLFGTIHLYCDEDKVRQPQVQSAVDSSEVVAMELNLNDFSTIVAFMKSSRKVSGKSLKNQLSAAEYKLVDSVCMALVESSLADFDGKSAMTVLSTLIISKEIVGCQGALPVDMIVADMAKKSGKTSYGLETFEFQDSLLNSISDTTQIKWLLEFCRDIPKVKAEFKAMMDAYDARESLALYDIMLQTSPEMALFSDVLLVQRNIRWARFMEDNMKTNVYFMAVGAGHLGGEQGLVSLLRKAGYTVVPVQID